MKNFNLTINNFFKISIAGTLIFLVLFVNFCVGVMGETPMQFLTAIGVLSVI